MRADIVYVNTIFIEDLFHLEIIQDKKTCMILRKILYDGLCIVLEFEMKLLIVLCYNH